MAQEAVSNAVKHGKAHAVLIDLAAVGTEVRLTVTDDGVGLGRAGADGKGIGLQTMDYRARVIGGRLEVGPGERGGTVVTCTVPVVRSEGTNAEETHAHPTRRQK